MTMAPPPVRGARCGRPQAHGLRQAGENLDSIQTALEIDRHLSELEDQARAHGSAVGSGFLYPVTVERIATWAKDLGGPGLCSWCRFRP